MSDLPYHLPLLPFFIFIFIFIIAVAGAQSNNNLNYPNCPSYNCGDVIISYPFWRNDTESTPQFCGYEGFGINCTVDDRPQRPIIQLGGDSYFVKNISYDTSSIVLIDYDVSPVVVGSTRDPNFCPRVEHNIDLETLPLNFSVYSVNLSFHFNCSGCPDFATEIPCLRYKERERSCVHIVNRERQVINWSVYSCDKEVVTTVFKEISDNPFPDIARSFGGDLQKGFELRWRTTEDCQMCEDSDGRCGRHNTTGFMCFCSDGTTTRKQCNDKGSKVNLRVKLVIGVISGLFSIVLIVIIYCIMNSSRSNCIASLTPKTEDDKSVEAFIIHYGSLSTKRYNYNDIKKMTNSFKVKLGQGGFGTVFKGKLSDDRIVAVKLLNSSKASGQEFINEVASIGRTSHIHIVTLLGFCFENKKRALVYEFMPNGSLEKFIHNNDPIKTSDHIGVNKLYEIALGIARGLDYLHRGCNTRILHLDIKPHNILLDEEFTPKIADFGLAKLYSRKESMVSMLEARGTIGYIAPEVFNKNFGGVSHKADVYSYGMLILEMVGGRKNVDVSFGSGHTSEIYFPYWIYSRLKKGEYLLDSITTVEDNEYARKMTIVGLWCIQADPKQRPSINEVIEMLEGSIEALEVPPKPFFGSPPRDPVSLFEESQSESGSLR